MTQLIDQFIPVADVVERHQIRVNAPAGVTYETCRELRMQRSWVIRLLIFIRTLPARFRGHADALEDRGGLLRETLAMGWGVLAQRPVEMVVGAVTQPWKGVVKFRRIPPDEFVTFNEPGYAKIVWTVAADPLGPGKSIARTETRVQTTDPVARRHFRRYWRMISPGVWLIRWAALRIVKREAERRAIHADLAKWSGRRSRLTPRRQMVCRREPQGEEP